MGRVGLQGRLVILVLLVLLPVVVLNGVQSYGRFTHVVERELQSDREMADAIAVAFTTFTDHLWDEEGTLGAAIVRSGTPVSPEELDHRLEAYLQANDSAVGVSWISLTDHSSQGITRPGWGDLPDPEHLVARVEAGETRLLSDLTPPSPEGHSFVIAARSIYVGDVLVGVVITYLDPNQFHRTLPITRSDPGSFGLIDRQGVMVYRYSAEASGALYGQRISADSPAHEALKGLVSTKASFQAIYGDGERIGAAVPIKGLGWVALVSTPKDAVLARPRYETLRDILVVAAVAALSLIAAVVLAGRYLRPLHALRRAAQAISLGDLTARAQVQGSDEVAETAKTFDQMADRIQELIGQRERFLQVAAHELRNPMTSIKGMLSLARRRVALHRPIRELDQMTAIMEREIDRLSDLLTEILDAYRVQDGRLALRRDDVDLRDVVRAAIEPCRVSGEESRLTVDVPPETPLRVWGDAGRLEEVVRNLLSNALKYSPNGSAVRVALSRLDNRALLRVSDSGVGIPEDQLGRIFERFYRVNDVSGKDPGGLGLGLYICRDIVVRHQGRIWAESIPGQGSDFFVELPLQNAEEVAS